MYAASSTTTIYLTLTLTLTLTLLTLTLGRDWAQLYTAFRAVDSGGFGEIESTQVQTVLGEAWHATSPEASQEVAHMANDECGAFINFHEFCVFVDRIDQFETGSR